MAFVRDKYALFLGQGPAAEQPASADQDQIWFLEQTGTPSVIIDMQRWNSGAWVSVLDDFIRTVNDKGPSATGNTYTTIPVTDGALPVLAPDGTALQDDTLGHDRLAQKLWVYNTGVGWTLIGSLASGVGFSLKHPLSTSDATITNPSSAPTAAENGAGNVTATSLTYYLTFVGLEGVGETAVGTSQSNALNPTSKQIELTSVPLGPTGTASRNIYRQEGAGAIEKVGNISDNVTTTFTDNVTSVTGNDNPPATNDTSQHTGQLPHADIADVNHFASSTAASTSYKAKTAADSDALQGNNYQTTTRANSHLVYDDDLSGQTLDYAGAGAGVSVSNSYVTLHNLTSGPYEILGGSILLPDNVSARLRVTVDGATAIELPGAATWGTNEIIPNFSCSTSYKVEIKRNSSTAKTVLSTLSYKG